MKPYKAQCSNRTLLELKLHLIVLKFVFSMFQSYLSGIEIDIQAAGTGTGYAPIVPYWN